MRLDGTIVPHTYDPTNQVISYTPPSLLSEGDHTVEITLQDTFGRSISASWSFTIKPAMVDVTSMVQVSRFNIRYNRRTGEISFNTNFTNISDQSIFSPIRMVFDNIQPSSAVVNADGTTAEGDPYFEFIIPDGELSPGETSPTRNIVFSDPQRLRFRFEVLVFGGLSGVGAGKRVPQKGITLTVPVEPSLAQNRPNPFNPVTTISYDITESSRVILSIYNLLGQEVRRLVDEDQIPGTYSVVWDGKDEQGQDVGAGVYLYRLRTKDFVKTRKMVLVR